MLLSKLFCGLCAWAILILGFFSILISMRKGIKHVKKLHQVPCAGCVYFTNDHRLKCTVNPILACTEDAIGCRDFESKQIVTDTRKGLTISQTLSMCQNQTSGFFPSRNNSTSRIHKRP
jgi:hypothetical protein